MASASQLANVSIYTYIKFRDEQVPGSFSQLHQITYFLSTIKEFTCFCVFIHILTLLNYKYNKYSPNIKIPIIRLGIFHYSLMTQVYNLLIWEKSQSSYSVSRPRKNQWRFFFCFFFRFFITTRTFHKRKKEKKRKKQIPVILPIFNKSRDK